MEKFKAAISYLMKDSRYENKNLLELSKMLEEKGFKNHKNTSFSLNDVNRILQLIKISKKGFYKPSSKSCGIVPDENPCGDANEY